MALSINQNVAAFNAYRNLSVTQGDLSKSLEKLSSGYRINRAADDAAGLAISEGLRSQVGGLKQAVRNSQDGISVVQTAEGALTETTSILQRMRTLSVQAASSGSLSEDAKGNIQSEIGELKSELTRIASTTQFNGRQLLDGSYNGSFQVGANKGETIAVNIATAVDASGLGVAGVNVTVPPAGATNAVTVNAVGGGTPTAGTVTTNVGNFSTAAAFDSLSGTITVGNKSIDLASVKYDALDSAATRLGKLSLAVGNAVPGVSVSLNSGNLVFTGTAPAANASADQVNAASVKFAQATGASDAISKIDAAIKQVSTTRAELGAKQNRLDHTINNLNVAVENLSASESRIRDTDMAMEMTSFTRSQILSQAGTAMLAQANQIPQGVLSLLR